MPDGSDAAFITHLHSSGDGPRVAVKDLIDVAGVPTTAGSRALLKTAGPATRDAACLAGLRAAGARIVGKTNLHELAMLPIGTNPWFGTPVNPLDPALIPGGSSSGSAVAVANGSADVALGSDTGGSVRVPAACCGVAGLKTTHGRVPLTGVWPLAPSLDTVGPMSVDVAGLVLGMTLLEPGFACASAPARRVGRVRTSGDPRLEAAVDRALQLAGFTVVDLEWSGLEIGAECFSAVCLHEIWDSDHELVESHPDDVGADVRMLMDVVRATRTGNADPAVALGPWQREVLALFDDVELLALPTMPRMPPRLDEVSPIDTLDLAVELTRHVSPFNAAGTPALAQPVPLPGATVSASLQLVGPPNGEELLLATAAVVEAALAQEEHVPGTGKEKS